MMIPSNQKFLQLPIPPDEYVSFFPWTLPGLHEYWQKLPTYLIARCPLCGAEYTDKVDAHRVGTTHDSHPSNYFETSKYEQVGCNHRLAVQKFVNLEGHIPSELNSYTGDLHVPFIIPFFLPDDIRSVAVIHSFAVCRLEDKLGRIYNYKAHLFEEPKTIPEMKDRKHRWRERPITDRSIEDTKTLQIEARFVPRYTAYAMTYFAEAPDVIVARRMKPQLELAEKDREFEPTLMSTMAAMKGEPHAYDLRYWVKRGKLYWLDLESLDLPLKNSPVDEFPYVDIPDISGELRQFKI